MRHWLFLGCINDVRISLLGFAFQGLVTLWGVNANKGKVLNSIPYPCELFTNHFRRT